VNEYQPPRVYELLGGFLFLGSSQKKGGDMH